MHYIKLILWKFFRPILSFFVFWKFGTIWNFKSFLQVKKNPNQLLLILYEDYFSRHGSWVGLYSSFSGEPCLPHGPVGIFISNGAKIGKNVVIFQQVTIGSNTLYGSPKIGSPTLEDNVYIGAGAKIIGNVLIGINCRIGANAVVCCDLAPNCVAVQSPTRIIRKENLDNRFFTQRNGQWVYFQDGNWCHGNFNADLQ